MFSSSSVEIAIQAESHCSFSSRSEIIVKMATWFKDEHGVNRELVYPEKPAAENSECSDILPNSPCVHIRVLPIQPRSDGMYRIFRTPDDQVKKIAAPQVESVQEKISQHHKAAGVPPVLGSPAPVLVGSMNYRIALLHAGQMDVNIVPELVEPLNPACSVTSMLHDDEGYSLIHHAAAAGNTMLVQYCIAFGIQPDLQQRKQKPLGTFDNDVYRIATGLTPLHLAAYYGHENVVRLLLHNGANPNMEGVVDAGLTAPTGTVTPFYPRNSARTLASCQRPLPSRWKSCPRAGSGHGRSFGQALPPWVGDALLQ